MNLEKHFGFQSGQNTVACRGNGILMDTESESRAMTQMIIMMKSALSACNGRTMPQVHGMCHLTCEDLSLLVSDIKKWRLREVT
jgi:hypothetical protein